MEMKWGKIKGKEKEIERGEGNNEFRIEGGGDVRDEGKERKDWKKEKREGMREENDVGIGGWNMEEIIKKNGW